MHFARIINLDANRSFLCAVVISNATILSFKVEGKDLWLQHLALRVTFRRGERKYPIGCQASRELWKSRTQKESCKPWSAGMEGDLKNCSISADVVASSFSPEQEIWRRVTALASQSGERLVRWRRALPRSSWSPSALRKRKLAFPFSLSERIIQHDFQKCYLRLSSVTEKHVRNFRKKENSSAQRKEEKEKAFVTSEPRESRPHFE